jgi:hypothetical protein
VSQVGVPAEAARTLGEPNYIVNGGLTILIKHAAPQHCADHRE